MDVRLEVPWTLLLMTRNQNGRKRTYLCQICHRNLGTRILTKETSMWAVWPPAFRIGKSDWCDLSPNAIARKASVCCYDYTECLSKIGAAQESCITVVPKLLRRRHAHSSPKINTALRAFWLCLSIILVLIHLRPMDPISPVIRKPLYNAREEPTSEQAFERRGRAKHEALNIYISGKSI